MAAAESNLADVETERDEMARSLTSTATQLRKEQKRTRAMQHCQTQYRHQQTQKQYDDRAHERELACVRNAAKAATDKAKKSAQRAHRDLGRACEAKMKSDRDYAAELKRVSDIAHDFEGDENTYDKDAAAEIRRLNEALVLSRAGKKNATRHTARKSQSIVQQKQKLSWEREDMKELQEKIKEKQKQIDANEMEKNKFKSKLRDAGDANLIHSNKLASVPVLKKARPQHPGVKANEFGHKYRAYIMHQLTNRIDPAMLHESLKANVRFYVPWVHNAPVLARAAAAAAAGVAAAAAAVAVAVVAGGGEGVVATGGEEEKENDSEEEERESEDETIVLYETLACSACHKDYPKENAEDHFSRTQRERFLARRCKTCIAENKQVDLSSNNLKELKEWEDKRLLLRQQKILNGNENVPSVSTIHNMRRQIQVLGETLAAWELLTFGSTGKWQLGHDGSEINQINTITVNAKMRLAPPSTPKRPTDQYKTITLRACYYTVGKTSQLETEAVEKCFENGRKLLTAWREMFEKLYPNHEHNIPDPAKFTIGLVAGGSVISDTAPQAQKMSGLIMKLAQDAKQKELEESGAWEDMDKEQQAEELHVELLKCVHHLRNLVIQKGAKAETSLMKEELEDVLEDVSNRERLEVNVDTLLRSIAKEFGTLSNAYAKGKGIKEFIPWMQRERKDAVLLYGIRSVGSRQDYAVEAAFPEYHNRAFYMRFLKQAQYQDDNILEDSIYVRLGSVVYVAALRARAIVFDKIAQRLRFLCNSKKVGLSFTHLHLSAFLNQLEKLLLRVQDDGSILMDPGLVVFGLEEDMEEEAKEAVAALDEYEKHLCQKPYSTVGGGKVEGYLATIRENMYSPAPGTTNAQATLKTSVILQAWAVGMLAGLHENMYDYLDSKDGKWSGKPSHSDLQHALGRDKTNNTCD